MKLARPRPDTGGEVAPVFEELFRTNYGSLVKALAPVCGYDAAAEAVQEAFVALYRHWIRIKGYDDPVAWVRRVALNGLIDLGRRNESQRRGTERLRRFATVTDDSVDAATEHMSLIAALTGLTARQRAVVGLYYFGDLQISEVARELQIAEGTVKATLSQARGRMTALLGGRYDDA